MKKFYITTSIVYVNSLPHLGFVLELIQADVLARYHRILGDDVFFLTGTDEHGLKIARKAEKEGKTPEEFVNFISSEFKKLAIDLNISNDDFIRTTDEKRHIPVVEKVWQELEKRGDIYRKKYKGLYCVGCEAFLQEKDLIDGKCPIHKTKPELIEEENYFFRFSKYSQEIKEKIKKKEINIIPEAKIKEVIAMIDGIGDISISRSRDKLKWGIPVPGDKSQTIYVWVDALLNYISALNYPDGEKFKKYWPADVHCIGKDIIKFHTSIWLAILLSLKLELPKKIFVHGFTNVNGQKMSKSIGNVVSVRDIVERYRSSIPEKVIIEAIRYFLLRESSATEDGDFTFQKFEERYNSDLASGIGNLVSRVRTMVDKKGFVDGQNEDIKKKIEEIDEKYRISLNNFKFNEALKFIWELVSFSDKYIEKEKPWEEKNNSKIILGNLLVILDNIAQMIEPFLPETAEKIKREIERDNKSGKFVNKKEKALFPRI